MDSVWPYATAGWARTLWFLLGMTVGAFLWKSVEAPAQTSGWLAMLAVILIGFVVFFGLSSLNNGDHVKGLVFLSGAALMSYGLYELWFKDHQGQLSQLTPVIWLTLLISLVASGLTFNLQNPPRPERG